MYDFAHLNFTVCTSGRGQKTTRINGKRKKKTTGRTEKEGNLNILQINQSI